MFCEDLAERVYRLVSLIPVGRVTTYKALAEACDTRSYRAVGGILRSNPNIPVVPCHRVVMSDGSLGGYARGVEEKRRMLEREGVIIREEKVDNFARVVVTASFLSALLIGEVGEQHTARH